MSLRDVAESGGKPVVLLATAERWTSTARLALALRALGCELVLLAPGDHPAASCGAVSRCVRYDPLRPLHSLRQALQSDAFTTVLPADETIVRQLGELWQEVESGSEEQGALGALLTRSLGDPARLCETGSRMVLQRAAEAEGVPTPATMEILTADDLREAFERLGSPLVLKADSSSGGRGVRIAKTPEEAESAFRAFSTAPHMPRAVLRGMRYRDWTHVRSSARRERRGVCAQTMIAGAERTAMAVAQRGEVLAVECFEVVHTWKLRGPSSVLRRVHDPRMEASVRAVAQRLEMTGFCGFDFIVDAASGVPLLLECNARPTQTAHLSFGAGSDLVAAYVRAMVGCADVRDRISVTSREMIALFPQELQRDPESPALREAFHDVPWESPALMEHVLRGDAALRAMLGAQRPVRRSRESGSFQVAG